MNPGATGRPEGRPKMPAERLRAHGETRPSRVPPIGNVVSLEPVRDEVPAPLRPLASAGLRLWTETWKHAWAWVARTDAEALQQLCEQLDERVALRLKVLREGHWRDRLALRQLDMQVLAGLGALGLTPTDRARMGVAEVNRVSKLDKLRRGRETKEAASEQVIDQRS